MRKKVKSFIKDPMGRVQYADSFYMPAFRFRRKFSLPKVGAAKLTVCGLGYGYYYLNGKRIGGDLYTAPVSDYNKTLWYTEYDVTPYLHAGENVLCAYLGNGFLNENFESAWRLDAAQWRDVPKLDLVLTCGAFCLHSDETFRVKEDGAIYYNQLRSGEYIDYRKEEDWLAFAYDDSDWRLAVRDDREPKGVPRVCACPPITEAQTVPCVRISENADGYILDFGRNFSGYIRWNVAEARDTELTVSYAEEIDDENRLRLNGLDIFYPSVPFQCDKIHCDGKEHLYSPLFTYHGFRYVQLTGLTRPPKKEEIQGIFVHQDVRQTGRFACSHPLLQKIYDAGIASSYSNMHYALTDCPTREKLGWTNDATASMEQLFYNFDILSFMQKWAQDICDAMLPDGSMPGIVPTHGWGYGIGPVTDGILFELPYRAYLHCGDSSIMRMLYPDCKRYESYLLQRLQKEEWFDLADWTGVRNKPTPPEFVDLLLALKFVKRMVFFTDVLQKKGNVRRKQTLDRLTRRIKKTYILPDGDCAIDEQTALAMLLIEGLGDREKLKKHLLDRIERDDWHVNCGMVGTQYLYEALSAVGEQETVLRLIGQPTPPSFAHWFAGGATTLYETFVNERTDSKNHHMFSNILGWMIKYVLGIFVIDVNTVKIAPLAFSEVDTVRGGSMVCGKNIEVALYRKEGYGEVTVPPAITVYYRGEVLPVGINKIIL